MTNYEFKTLRKRLKLRQETLAEMLGIGTSTIFRYEKGPDDIPLWLEYAFKFAIIRHFEL